MFTTKLHVSMDIGSSDRILMGHLIYKDNFFGSIVIPRGFRTNYASIPKVVPRWWLDQDDVLIREPSVLHDWLYDKACPLKLTRKEADKIFLTAMLRQCRKGNWYRRNMNKLKARSAYRSVRLMGASHWKK